MGKIMTLDMSQFEALNAKLLSMGAAVGIELENALNDEAQVIATVAKELVPVDLGNLRASIKVNPTVRALHENGEIFVDIVAGDVSVQYAQIQEEDESFKHRVGQAHYMQEAAEKSLVGVEARIIARIARVK